MADERTSNGWPEYQKLVLHELQQLNVQLVSLNTKISDLEKDVARLEAKSGVWGFLGGAAVVAISISIGWLKG